MSNESIDKMIEMFKTEEDLRKYANAQFKTITKLTQQIAELKRENEELKTSKPISVAPQVPQTLLMAQGSALDVTDEEAIAVMQLRILKDLALVRELTLEECKKFDILNKNLREIRNIPKKVEINAKDLSSEQLISMIDESTAKPN